MTRQFNNICYFIIAEILRHKTPKTRARIIDYFIKVAKKLFSLNNINSMKSIISALQSSPIYRLRDSFELLSKKNIDLFQKYEKFFSEDNNRKQLRSHIDTSQIPCIPYLGIYLTDLIYVDSLYPTLETQHKERLERMCCIIKSIQKFQESKYGSYCIVIEEFVDINPQLIDFFLKDRYIDELKKFVDDRFYQ
uniref:Ras-specific guanine nucleotide-releasing factor RalGPS2 (Trinotate prediction) n=1 Tax=Henneguya salminicola TaxID=69463 RepID=A0A6G3MG31_HENSL